MKCYRLISKAFEINTCNTIACTGLPWWTYTLLIALLSILSPIVIQSFVRGMGFGSQGIEPGTLASRMMSHFWIWGHNIQLVSRLQRIGVQGLSASEFAVITLVTAALLFLTVTIFWCKYLRRNMFVVWSVM